MLFWLIILFTTKPVIELLLLIELGKALGTWTAVLIVLGTGFFGALLAKAQGFSIMLRIRSQLQSGILPTKEMLRGLCVLIGGILLITPGLLTDLSGLLLLFPPFQDFVSAFIGALVKRGLTGRFYYRRPKSGKQDVGNGNGYGDDFFVQVESAEDDEDVDDIKG